MKPILVVACILAITALPAMVPAQGLPALGGIPAIGSLFGSIGAYGDTSSGKVAPPTFCVGWLGQGKGANFGIGLDSPFGNVVGMDQTMHLNGLALGISDAIALSDRISVILSGWWIVPATSRSFESYDVLGLVGRRDWSAETNWWWADALAACNIGGGVAVLGGFRFDRFETRFNNPELNPNFVPLSVLDEANVKSNGYIPLVGLLYTTGGGGNVLTAYAVGFPTLLGRAEYHETVDDNQQRFDAAGNYNEGYFFETRLDYTRRIMGEAKLGAFFRFNATRGTFSGSAEAKIGGVGTVGTSSFRGGLNRTSFTLGGSLNLPFRLPFI